MELFHGTNVAAAKNIIGSPHKVDVSLGGGELGRGFYTGFEPALAASLARGRYKENPAVLQINIDNSAFVALNIVHVKYRTFLKQKWNILRKTNETKTFLFGTDLVMAPFATFDLSHQYKFESLAAQNVLNQSDIIKILG